VPWEHFSEGEDTKDPSDKNVEIRKHSNLASFKKPKIQFNQCQDAQTSNCPVLMYRANTPETKTSSFKTAKIQNAHIQNAQFQKAQISCIVTSS
jgi:hypothetical protein